MSTAFILVALGFGIMLSSQLFGYLKAKGVPWLASIPLALFGGVLACSVMIVGFQWLGVVDDHFEPMTSSQQASVELQKH